MSTKKSLNYLDNQNQQPTTAKETLDEDNFFIEAIFDISHEVKNNQQINTIAEETNDEWSVTLSTNGTNVCYKIDSGVQVNAIPENQIETLQTKPRITKLTINLSAFNRSNMPAKGQCTLDIHHRGKNVPLLFIVADTNSPPIIGLTEGARNSQDDIIIWGSSQNQLDIRTEQVLNRIRKSGLKLNKDSVLLERPN